MCSAHVPTCCHQELSNFTGDTQVHAGNGVLISMVGKFEGLDKGAPLMVDIELPQYREVPWWFRAYMYVAASSCCWDTRPRITIELEPGETSCWLGGVNCSEWTLSLPMVPVAIDMRLISGYLPLCFVMRQGTTEYGRFTVQQVRYCTRLGH